MISQNNFTTNQVAQFMHLVYTIILEMVWLLNYLITKDDEQGTWAGKVYVKVETLTYINALWHSDYTMLGWLFWLSFFCGIGQQGKLIASWKTCEVESISVRKDSGIPGIHLLFWNIPSDPQK